MSLVEVMIGQLGNRRAGDKRECPVRLCGTRDQAGARAVTIQQAAGRLTSPSR